MGNKKIISFPRPAPNHIVRAQEVVSWQMDLFGDQSTNAGRVVFLEIRSLNEEILLNAIIRNGVSGVVDLRPRPAFQRPHFHHQAVTHFLYENNVLYFEYAMNRPPFVTDGVINISNFENVCFAIDEILNRGLTVCLYDDASRSIGWLDELRGLLKHLPHYVAELHPRSLVGT